MISQFFYFLKKDWKLNLVIFVELVVACALLSMSFSMILTSKENPEARALFTYIGMAAFVLFFFTVALVRVINGQKNSEYYANCIMLGMTKKRLLIWNTIKTTLLYLLALCFAVLIMTWVISSTSIEDGDIEVFLSYKGILVMLGVYVIMYAVNIIPDLFTMYSTDYLEQVRGGTDNE